MKELSNELDLRKGPNEIEASNLVENSVWLLLVGTIVREMLSFTVSQSCCSFFVMSLCLIISLSPAVPSYHRHGNPNSEQHTNKWCCKVYAVMGVEEATPPTTQRPEHWQHFDDSVNALSFGFVATAILISMFLLLAIFERFLRQRSAESSVPTTLDLEHQMDFGVKLENLSPKMTIYGRGVFVLMPGEQIPTFIALPAPAPCHSEPISWPIHSTCFPSPLASITGYNISSN
ncbi:hypothetical protein VNO77_36910 [Canavalia gladiata]|uniref:Uncharacterized protein n=1 Tax=Canavalia gladiata TaxID=3824 RepID=A0AAN9K8C2_CANGL